ncbi:hypothetical protein ERJ75_000683600 [Trypanosoma vivax]|nr:hypothetical protein ERJ75_000683600 [Trypanosoma vivax]
MRAGGGCHGVAAAVCELCVTPRFGGCGRATAAQKRAVAHAHRQVRQTWRWRACAEGMSHSGARFADAAALSGSSDASGPGLRLRARRDAGPCERRGPRVSTTRAAARRGARPQAPP